MEEKVRKRNLSFIFSILIFLLSQAAIYMINFSKIYAVGNRIYIGDKEELYKGNIFFTGDTRGTFDLTGCGKSMGSISRRSHFLKKFKDYLYIDIGNFTQGSAKIDNIAVPLIIESYRYMRLSLFNLTKRDMVNIANSNSSLNESFAVSANLEIINPSAEFPGIPGYKVIPLKLRSNNKEQIVIEVGVTGISGNSRVLSRKKRNFRIKDMYDSLSYIYPSIEGSDIKILMFDDKFSKLKTLILQNKFQFDLVLARPTFPGQGKNILYIDGTPVLFSDELGKSLGWIKVYKKGGKYLYDFDRIEIRRSLKENEAMKSLTMLYKKKLKELDKEL